MENLLVLSSDSHVFEPPDLWTERIDAEFRDRAPRMQRVGDVDHLVVEQDQMIAGIGLISNAGARFENPEQISAHGRFEDVEVGGYDPEQHIRDMKIDGVSGELLYPSQGLFYFKVEDSRLMSAIFRTYNDWLAEFCSTNPDRLKGVAMINVDDVSEGVAELERCARLGMAAAMITEYPQEDRRYDNPEYEPFWAAAQDLDMPISLHTATRREGQSRGADATSVRAASGRATKVFYPATSVCDIIFSGVFERYPKFKLAIVEFELSWVPYLLDSMDYTYIERQEEASYRFRGDARPSDFLPQQRVPELPGGCRWYPPARHHWRRPAHVGQRLPTLRVHLPPLPRGAQRDPRGRPHRRAGQHRRRCRRRTLRFRNRQGGGAHLVIGNSRR